jgi:hypothetical protein
MTVNRNEVQTKVQQKTAFGTSFVNINASNISSIVKK